MLVSRRAFVRGVAGAIAGLSAPHAARAAAAGSSRLYHSPLEIREIARGLIAGIGREVLDFVQSFDKDRLREFIAKVNVERFETRLQTLRGGQTSDRASGGKSR